MCDKHFLKGPEMKVCGGGKGRMMLGLETTGRALGFIAGASGTRGERGCDWHFKNITSAAMGSRFLFN